MKVVIPLASLQKYGACPAYLDSPEWDDEKKELVYMDWTETVQRLLSTKLGTSYLDWLIGRKLVPMTHEEFIVAREDRAEFMKKTQDQAATRQVQRLVRGRVIAGGR